MKFDNIVWLWRQPQKSSFVLSSFLLVWCWISNTNKVLGYKKKAKVFFIPCLSKLCQISANLRWKFSCYIIQLETQQAQGEGAENTRREIRTRREILKKESDFKYFLLCRSCCRHKSTYPCSLCEQLVSHPRNLSWKEREKKNHLDIIANLLQIFSDVPLSSFYSFKLRSHNYEK